MILDLILAFVLIVSTLRGYQKGLASKLIGVAGILTSYVASMVLYRPLGDVLRDTYGVPPLIAYGGGGMGVFFVVTLLFTVADAVRRGIMQRHMVTLTALDRTLGALLGFLTGAVYAVLTLLVAFVLPPSSPVAAMLQTSESILLEQARPLTNSLTAEIGSIVLGDKQLGQVVSHTLAHPLTVSREIRELLASPATAAVMADHELMEKVRKGNVDAAMQDSRVKELFKDAAAKKLETDFDAVKGDMPDAQRRSMLKMLAIIEKIRSTPTMQQIVADPEIQGQLQKGDIVGLMKNRKLGQILTGQTAVQEGQP